jgi:hypothetical protein
MMDLEQNRGVNKNQTVAALCPQLPSNDFRTLSRSDVAAQQSDDPSPAHTVLAVDTPQTLLGTRPCFISHFHFDTAHSEKGKTLSISR